MSFEGQQQPSSVPNRQQQQLTSMLPTQIQPHPQHSTPQQQQQQQQSSTTTIMPAGEPRKKRAKIVSACAECRRKKTKCNGEQPCRNCEKSGVQCIYPALLNNQHPMADRRNNAMTNDGGSTISKAALESIEQRLKSIEDMLRHIIYSQQQQHQTPQQGQPNWSTNSANPTLPSIAFQQQQRPQQQHISSLSAPYPTSYQPHILLQEQQNRQSLAEDEGKKEVKLEVVKTEVLDSPYYPALPPRSSSANTTTNPSAASITTPPAPTNSTPASSIQPPFQTASQPLLPSIRSLPSYTSSSARAETAATSTQTGEGDSSDDSRELPPLLPQSPPNSNNGRNYSYAPSTSTMITNAVDDDYQRKRKR